MVGGHDGVVAGLGLRRRARRRVVVVVIVIVAGGGRGGYWGRIRGEMLVEAVVSHGRGGGGGGHVGRGGLLDGVLAVDVADGADLVPQNSEK